MHIDGRREVQQNITQPRHRRHTLYPPAAAAALAAAAATAVAAAAYRLVALHVAADGPRLLQNETASSEVLLG